MTNIVGGSPVTFTDAVTGEQWSIPLSAFTWDGKAPNLTTAWSKALPNPWPDLQVVQKLIQNRISSQEYVPAAAGAPRLAIGFQAAQPGPEGNNLILTVKPKTTPSTATPSVFNTTVAVQVTWQDVYAGLKLASQAVTAIGLNAKSTAPGAPAIGTGPVQVTSGWPLTNDGFPVAVTGPSTFPLDITDATNTTLFTLAANANTAPDALPPGATPTVTVTIDSSGTTFTLSASYAATVSPQVALDQLFTPAALGSDAGFFVSPFEPPDGPAPPSAPQTPVSFNLTGGSSGVAATGFATS